MNINLQKSIKIDQIQIHKSKWKQNKIIFSSPFFTSAVDFFLKFLRPISHSKIRHFDSG